MNKSDTVKITYEPEYQSTDRPARLAADHEPVNITQLTPADYDQFLASKGACRMGEFTEG